MMKMNKARRLERLLVQQSKIILLSIVGIDCIALSEITELLLNKVAWGGGGGINGYSLIRCQAKKLINLES